MPWVLKCCWRYTSGFVLICQPNLLIETTEHNILQARVWNITAEESIDRLYSFWLNAFLSFYRFVCFFWWGFFACSHFALPSLFGWSQLLVQRVWVYRRVSSHIQEHTSPATCFGEQELQRDLRALLKGNAAGLWCFCFAWNCFYLPSCLLSNGILTMSLYKGPKHSVPPLLYTQI